MPSRRDKRDVELDYSPSSGAIGSDEKKHDHEAPIAPEANKQTTFSPKDHYGQNETVYRNGELWEKWHWLERVDDGVGEKYRSAERRDSDLKRDLITIGEQFPLEDKVIRRAVVMLQDIRRTREGGLSFGDTNPLEVTQLAALSLSARKDITVNSFKEIETDTYPLHDAGFEGPVFRKLMNTWTPENMDCDKSKIREMRSKLGGALIEGVE